MPNRLQDLLKVRELREGEECTVNWFSEGGGIIYRIGTGFDLYSVPQYGGQETYEASSTYLNVEDLLNLAYTWT